MDFKSYHNGLSEILAAEDSQVYDLISREYERLRNTIQLIAAENQCSRAVLAALGSIVQNKTAEGVPSARYHGGCEVVDDIERLAVERAKQAFGARYANVQPHSGTTANQIVLCASLDCGDRILSMDVSQGGHWSHSYKYTMTGKLFNVRSYGVDRKTLTLDYDDIRKKAVEFRPKLIICGASAYPRAIDFKKFRAIADEAGALLLADISHLSALVLGGVHESPVDHAHFVTTSTYKPGGPRGGVIVMGKDFETQWKASDKSQPLWKHIQEAVFPGMQGTPYFNNMAAKAVFFKEAQTDLYRSRQKRVVENAARLASVLSGRGFDLVTGGTDTHMVLFDIAKSGKGLTGIIAEKSLEECGIVTNKIELPFDKSGSSVTSGLRLGTPIVTRSGMGTAEMETIAGMVDKVLREVKPVGGAEYKIDHTFVSGMRGQAKDLCERFPVR